MEVEPLFKNKFKPIYRNNEILHIGFETQSLGISDPNKTIENLLNECDGNKSVNELCKLINLTYDETLDIIEDLSKYGIFEKCSSYNLKSDKYKTNLNYYENFTSLEKSKTDIHEKFRI